MILVDTSAWIDFFRGRAPLANCVERAVEENQAALCGPVIMELARGFKSSKDRQTVLGLLSGCQTLTQPDQLWQDAGTIGFVLGRKGKTIKSMDLLIACYSLAHSAPILTGDKDFFLMRDNDLNLEVLDSY